MNTPSSQDWLDSVTEDIIDPEQRIIDPHHHLWRHPGREYVVENLHGDTGSGHNIVKTVFVECHAEYLKDGPEHLRPLGETQFVAEQAAESANRGGAEICGIVAHADLSLGQQLVEVLAGHEASGKGLFRGIRHAGARATHPEELFIPGAAPKGLYADPNFRAGVRLLGSKGYSFDTWHYHYQNQEFYDLAAMLLQKSVDWQCRTMASVGTPAPPHLAQTSLLKHKALTIYTPSNVLARNAACSKATSPLTDSLFPIKCYTMD
jgi:L-fuconolactonase